MAQQTFLPLLKISATAEFLIFLGILVIIQLQGIAAKSTSHRIDDGGITVPNELPLHSRQLLAIKNRPLTLHCPIIISRDVRILELWWVKDGSKIDLNPQSPPIISNVQPPQSRIYITDDGDLHFEKIIHKVGVGRSTADLGTNTNSRHGKNYTDEGEYRCAVKSANGMVFSPVITVSIGVLEAREDVEIKVKVGQAVLIPCQVASTPPLTSANVNWQRGQTNISRLAQESNRFSILASGSLAIFGVELRDTGNYRCFARHEVLNVNKSGLVKLVVEPANELVSQEPPKFLFPEDYNDQKTVILEEDEEYTIDCGAYGIPNPTITWVLTYEIANETSVSPFSKILAEGKEFHDILTITSENSVERGNYTCVASNSAGTPITKTIPVIRLPALLRGPYSYKYPPAKTVRFECKVPPVYTLIWYKDGQILETGKGRVKTKGNEIVISNTIRNDSGFYQCEVVSDSHIYAVGTGRLSVENNQEAPDAPFDLQCIQSFPKHLVISWKVHVRENITAFTIHYMPIGGEEYQKVTPSRSNNFTIDNLKSYTNYSIYVRSYSIKSASAQSQRVVCSTLEDVPIKVPRNFILEEYGPSSQIRVRWRPLSGVDARGKVILYKLQWRSIDGEYTNVRYIDGESEEFLITEFSPGGEFELRMLPSTSAGWPLNKEDIPWTRVNSTNIDINATTTPENLYDPPIMDLTVLNSTSILVNWSEPPRPKSLHLKGYRLTYSTEVGRVEDFVFFGPIYIYDYSEKSFLFSNFVPSTSYEVHLQTFGDSWESKITSRFIRTFSSSNEDGMSSSSTVIPAISGLQVFPISSSKVRLVWEQPKSLNSQMHYYYTVRYNKADGNDYRFISSTSESVEIKELEPFTSYEFSVQIMEGEESGPFSQKIESRTLPGIPGSPVQLHWRVLNQTLVEIEWHPPPSSNGVIQKYVVQYKHKNESADFGNNSTSPNGIIWKSKATKNTSLFLENLLQNEEYIVRVIAETRAGQGSPSETILVRIFMRKPKDPEQKDDPKKKDDPLTQIPNNPQHLVGIIIGVGLSLLFILVCVIIIAARHRLFPMLTRQPVGVHVNGNGFPPRAKRSVESFTGVEMKVIANDQHLDTKGGHNGNIPGPTDPLLMRIARNPNDDHYCPEDEESVPNCIH